MRYTKTQCFNRRADTSGGVPQHACTGQSGAAPRQVLVQRGDGGVDAADHHGATRRARAAQRDRPAGQA